MGIAFVYLNDPFDDGLCHNRTLTPFQPHGIPWGDAIPRYGSPRDRGLCEDNRLGPVPRAGDELLTPDDHMLTQWKHLTVAAQRPRDEPPGQPGLVSRRTQHPAGRVGSIELLGSPIYQGPHPLKVLREVVGCVLVDEIDNSPIVRARGLRKEVANRAG